MTTKLVATKRGLRVLNTSYFILGCVGTAGVILLSGVLETYL